MRWSATTGRGATPRGVLWLIGRLLTSGLLLSVSAVSSQSLPSSAEVSIARKVLVLFDGDREPEPADTRVHKYAEMVLNHLGYIVDYRDIRAPLPAASEVASYAGLLTWFSGPPVNRTTYLDWARTTVRSARRFIVMGSVGGEFWTDDYTAMAAILGEFGLKHERRAVELTVGTQTVAKARKLTAFERELDPVLPTYDVVTANRPGVDEWLSLALPQWEGGGRSVVAAVTPRGGYVQAGYELYEEPSLGRVAWLIDPFAFFTQALHPERWPIPDVTTLSGRRVYFSHVDSDGLNNVVATPTTGPMLVASVFASEIVDKYPTLPVTLALTPGDLDSSIGGNETPRELVRELWSKPNVEASVASYTRPYRWRFFENYSREQEETAIAEAQRSDRFGVQALATYFHPPTRMERFIANGPKLPRNYLLDPFTLSRETEVALTVAQSLAPSDRPIRLYQWTGDANPFESAIAATRKLHLHNINGGETRMDANYPSVAYVTPLARPVGAERQLYAVGAGEFATLKAWRPAVAALEGLQVTLQNTELPRRLQAFNLHYHLSTIGNPDARRAIKGYLWQAQVGSFTPISTADYAAAADDYFGVEITKVAGQKWRVSRRGTVQTVRFDEADKISVDLKNSVGVLGQNRHAGSLYVALDKTVEPAVVALQNATSPDATYAGLKEARWRIWNLSRTGADWSFETQGFGRGDFTWQGVLPGHVVVTAHQAESEVWRTELDIGSDGELRLSIPISGTAALSIDVVHRFGLSEQRP